MNEPRERVSSFLEEEWPSFRSDAEGWRKYVEESLRRLFRRELAHDADIRALKSKIWIASALRSSAPQWLSCLLLLALLVLKIAEIAHGR